MAKNGKSEKTVKSVVACRFCGQEFLSTKDRTAMELLRSHAYNSHTCKGKALHAAKVANQQLDAKYGGYPGAYKEYLKSLIAMNK